MKQYTVYYVIKMNSHSYTYSLDVSADTAKHAVANVKDYVWRETGRNAFTPTTKAPTNPKVEVIKGLPPCK
jgi:hypothetical protein